jgi:predicted RNase H-like HicB family nuclease
MSRYVVLLEEGPSGFSAYSPDLPGCVAAAETREEAERLMGEALESHVAMLRDRGEPVPAPSTSAAVVEV